MKRRKFLFAVAAASAGGVGISSGCGGGGGQSEAPPSAADASWSVTPDPILRIGHQSVVFDLSPTLPLHIRRGGRFAVDSRGKPLPNGVVLTPQGVLMLTNAAQEGQTTGIVFSYDEPAT
jgi:hypothetical protein